MVVNIPNLIEQMGGQREPLDNDLGLVDCPTCVDGVVSAGGGAWKVCPTCKGARKVGRETLHPKG